MISGAAPAVLSLVKQHGAQPGQVDRFGGPVACVLAQLQVGAAGPAVDRQPAMCAGDARYNVVELVSPLPFFTRAYLPQA